MSSMILVVQVGFENSSYLAAEDAGSVSVCVTITGQLVRDIVVTLSTAEYQVVQPWVSLFRSKNNSSVNYSIQEQFT